MPSHPQTPTRSTSASRILLVEEYDALAVAISSALKKFAPQHQIDVAGSLAEGEAFAQAVPPALLVIDFDPEQRGLTPFLYRMRDVCPDARTLVIGAGVSEEIAAEFRSFGALHFIAKPFEVADLGATVQALLVPENAGSGRTRKNLSSLGLADIVLAQCAGARTVVVDVHGKKDKFGEIHIVDGQLVHASAGKRKDGTALEEMFEWIDPRIEEIDRRSSGHRSIRQPWTDVFFEALHNVRPQQLTRPAPVAPAAVIAPAAPTKPRIKTGKKLVVIDDTEMLLVFVEDTLALADPELQITTAPNGLTGIKQVESVMPDLVLLDYSLPDINGDEVCRRLLQNERTARIPILMMSGHIPEMTAASQDLGNVVATIAKPFLSDAFVALVKHTLSAGPRPVTKVIKPIEAKEAPKKITAPAKRRARAKPILAAPPPAPPVKSPPPLPPEEPTAPPPPPAPPPIQVVAPPIEIPRPTTISAPVVSPDKNEVVLGLFLEVTAMQLTPSLHMGTIRAKPSSLTVSLHVSPAALRAALPVETGFELGPVELDPSGKIDKVRLTPTLQPFHRLQTRNALQIGELDVVAHNSHDHVQLTPSQNAPMMMHLLAHLELVGVELNPNFQVAHVDLKAQSNTVRVTLNSEAVGQEQTGVFCETAAVELNSSAQIAELLLKPLK